MPWTNQDNCFEFSYGSQVQGPSQCISMEGSVKLQFTESWFCGDRLFRGPFPLGHELMGPYPEDWIKWFEWKFCRKGSGREFGTPELLVWSVSSIRKSSAAAMFPNEKGLHWTFAEGVLCVCCWLGCCGDATGSSRQCSISFCVQKRKHQGLGTYGYCWSSSRNYTKKATILSPNEVSRPRWFQWKQATALTFHLTNYCFLVYVLIYESQLDSIELTCSVAIILQQFHSLVSVALWSLTRH